MDMELLEAIGQMLEPVKGQMDKLTMHIDGEFAQVKKRLGQVDELAVRMDSEFARMDERMNHMEVSMRLMDSRMNHMAASMKLMNARMDKMDERLDRMDERFERLEDAVAQIREDSEITRAAANELLEWSTEISRASGFPLPELGKKIS